jgi:hypothetical protein
VVCDSLARELGERRLDSRRWDRDEHEIGAVELLFASAEGPDLESIRQPDPRQVALVLARRLEAFGLLRCAAKQRGAESGPIEQERDGRAERARPDDRRTTRLMSAGTSDRPDPGYVAW